MLSSAIGCGAAAVRRPDAAAEPPPTQWLTDLSDGTVLTYRVRLDDQPTAALRLRVTHLMRRSGRVAARLTPVEPIPSGVSARPIWLVGDLTGLSQLAANEEIAPELHEPTTDRVDWRVPPSGREDRGAALAGGWSIDELDLAIDSEIPGEQCSRISKRSGAERTSISVCANVGIAEVTRERDGRLREQWMLVEVGDQVRREL